MQSRSSNDLPSRSSFVPRMSTPSDNVDPSGAADAQMAASAQLALAVVLFVRCIDPRVIDNLRSVAAAPSKDRRALWHLLQEEGKGKCPSILAVKTEHYSPSSTYQQCDKLPDNPRMCRRCQKEGLPECPPRRKWEPKRDKVGRETIAISCQFTNTIVRRETMIHLMVAPAR